MQVQIRVMKKLMRRWWLEHLGVMQRRQQLSPSKLSCRSCFGMLSVAGMLYDAGKISSNLFTLQDAAGQLQLTGAAYLQGT